MIRFDAGLRKVEACRLKWFVLFLLMAPLEGQVEIGVTGGIPFTPFILNSAAGNRFGSSQVASAPRRYTLGPYLDFPLRGPVSIEAGALYKRFGFDISARDFFSATHSFTTGNSWEFPILAKVHLRFLPKLNGFLSAGPSIRRLTGVTETGERTSYPMCPPPCGIQIVDYKTDSPAGMNRRTSIGAAFGAGFDFRVDRILFSPGFRVTRWDSERSSGEPASSRLARTQAEALLNIGYSRGESSHLPIPCCFEVGLIAGLSLLPGGEIHPELTVPNTQIDAPARRSAVGAMLDWRFHSRWSLEGSFLTRPFGHTATYVSNVSTSAESVSGYAWEVPLLLKWRAARSRPAALVVGAGPSFRRASNIDWTNTFTNSAYTNTVHLGGSSLARSAFGATLSGGVEVKTGRLRLRPEIRYSWFDRSVYDFYFVKPRQDSLVLIFGVSEAGR